MPRGVRVAIAPHGGWEVPMRGQTRVLGNGVPKRQVALGSTPRKAPATQVLGVLAWVASLSVPAPHDLQPRQNLC